MKKTYTFLVMNNGRTSTKKIVIPHKNLVLFLAGMACVAIGFSIIFLDYASLLYRNHMDVELTHENQKLKTQLAQMNHKMGVVELSLSRLDVFAKKLKVITQVEDPERDLQLAMGDRVKPKVAPLFRDPGSKGGDEFIEEQDDEVVSENLAMEDEDLAADPDLSVRMDLATVNAEMQEKNLLELWQNLSDRIELLGATPSVMPTNGWITSKFGLRKSPFRSHQVMHKGLDIAASFGTPVKAPAAGVVSYVGFDNGYGNLVSIDHGYGVVTRYGHNAKVHVKYGQRVDRGQLISSVGSTGKSTGPHLHYEVRVNGMPVDPKRYILTE